MKILGIDVHIHWSFLILVGLFAFQGAEHGPIGAVIATMLLGAVFMCVLLHEFGHALAARRLGIGTTDITLYPLGGVARLERMPKDGRHELFITVCGPLVNVVLAGLFYVVSLFFEHRYVDILVYLNVTMILFNLIPAFPMDGGRILRSSLYLLTKNYVTSTMIATTIGKICALGFVGYGFYAGMYMLPLIGLFVFMAAHAESLRVRGKLAGFPADSDLEIGEDGQDWETLEEDKTNANS